MRDTLPAMSKDQIFRFRLDDADRERLDLLADYYSAPAATVVRILVKEKARELGLEPATKTAEPAPVAVPSPVKKPAKGKGR